jgi:calcium permeable stress-gated cation channel
MPLQLLNLGVIIPHFFYRMFLTRTPRGVDSLPFSHPIAQLVADFAELNAPPMINYGVVYPQAILIFVITLLYSVVQPLIVIFGAIYFGIGYVVYKYKLLFGKFQCLRTTMTCLINSQSFTNLTSHKGRLGQ